MPHDLLDVALFTLALFLGCFALSVLLAKEDPQEPQRTDESLDLEQRRAEGSIRNWTGSGWRN